MAGQIVTVIQRSSLEDKLLSCGATVVGFGDVSRCLAKEFVHIPKAISIGLAHPHASSVLRSEGKVAYNNQLPEIDQRLEQIQKRIVRLLKGQGFKALAIPPDSLRVDQRFIARLFSLFPHKTAATCAGLGWIGKSGLLINSRFGSRMSWATVLTNAEIEVSRSPFTTGRCGSCRRCVEACPVQAISDHEWSLSSGKGQIDTEACARYLMENERVVGRAICGLCILVCPYNNKKGE